MSCQYIGDGEGKRKMGAWCTSQRQRPEKDPAEDPYSAWWVERWGIKRLGRYRERRVIDFVLLGYLSVLFCFLSIWHRLESSGKRDGHLGKCVHHTTCGQVCGVFSGLLFDMGEPSAGGATLGRSWRVEESKLSKPCSCVLCFRSCPDFPWLWTATCRSKQTFSLPGCFWSWHFIRVTESKQGQASWLCRWSLGSSLEEVILSVKKMEKWKAEIRSAKPEGILGKLVCVIWEQDRDMG